MKDLTYAKYSFTIYNIYLIIEIEVDIMKKKNNAFIKVVAIIMIVAMLASFVSIIVSLF